MTFREDVEKWFTDNGIVFTRVEQDGEISLVLHIPKSENEKVSLLKDKLEKDLKAISMQSDSFGMNVVVIEREELE